MSINNAIKIVESLGVINVNYKGNSVWIERVNEETNQVNIKDLKTNQQFVVNVSEISES